MNHIQTELDPSLVAAVDNLVQQRIDERLAGMDLPDNVTRQKSVESKKVGGLSMIVFSGDLDKLLAAFTLATAAASLGLQVSMFFTFWGLVALKQRTRWREKNWAGRMMSAMLPCRPSGAPTSRLNCFGMGPRLFKWLMRKKSAASLEELIGLARQLDVKFVACKSVMELMNIEKDELIEGVEFAGAASFLSTAVDSRMTLFI